MSTEDDITIILKNVEQNGEAGMDITMPGFDKIAQRQREDGCNFTVPTLFALMIYRMLERGVLQPQIDIWCPDLMQEVKMAEMKRKAEAAGPANDG